MELPPVFGVSVFSIEIICDVTLMAHIKVDTQRFKYFLSIFFFSACGMEHHCTARKGLTL